MAEYRGEKNDYSYTKETEERSMAEELETQKSIGDMQHDPSHPTCSSDETINNQSQAQPSLNEDFQKYPFLYPTYFHGFHPLQQNQEQANHGRGLYAVPTHPLMGPTTGFLPNTLIPFNYNLPSASSSPGTAAAGQEHGQQQQLLQQPQALQPGQLRPVRRFQIAFQLDLLLILKLVAVIFLFNQDGSRQRLILLVFLSSLVYLYQTGALAPLVRWLSQGMHRAAAPPRIPRPDVRADNAHAAERAGNDNVAAADGLAGGVNENENEPLIGNRGVENEQGAEPVGAEGGNRLWVIVKEIQMIVFGFITSLLPGFHNLD